MTMDEIYEFKIVYLFVWNDTNINEETQFLAMVSRRVA